MDYSVVVVDLSVMPIIVTTLLGVLAIHWASRKMIRLANRS